MLPKILRMRRELVLSPLVVFRGASIALVAMCFPALRGDALVPPRNCFPAVAGTWSGAPAPRPSPMRVVRAPFGPCPGEDGKSPGAHVTVRRSRLFVGFARYSQLRAGR